MTIGSPVSRAEARTSRSPERSTASQSRPPSPRSDRGDGVARAAERQVGAAPAATAWSQTPRSAASSARTRRSSRRRARARPAARGARPRARSSPALGRDDAAVDRGGDVGAAALPVLEDARSRRARRRARRAARSPRSRGGAARRRRRRWWPRCARGRASARRSRNGRESTTTRPRIQPSCSAGPRPRRRRRRRACVAGAPRRAMCHLRPPATRSASAPSPVSASTSTRTTPIDGDDERRRAAQHRPLAGEEELPGAVAAITRSTSTPPPARSVSTRSTPGTSRSASAMRTRRSDSQSTFTCGPASIVTQPRMPSARSAHTRWMHSTVAPRQ